MARHLFRAPAIGRREWEDLGAEALKLFEERRIRIRRVSEKVTAIIRGEQLEGYVVVQETEGDFIYEVREVPDPDNTEGSRSGATSELTL